MRAHEFITEAWSKKYKRSIDCSRPRGFSQRAHCAGRKKRQVSEQAKLSGPSCGDIQQWLGTSDKPTFSHFDQVLKNKLALQESANTLEAYGVYLKYLSKQQLTESQITPDEEKLFNEFSQRCANSISDAAVGDRVALLSLSTLNIPEHQLVARLSGFLSPKKISAIHDRGNFQQLEFTDGSRYPRADDSVFSQIQTHTMTKLFASRTAASEAYMFYGIVGKNKNSNIDLTIQVDTSEKQINENYNAVQQLRLDLEQEQNVLKKLDPSQLYTKIDGIMQKIAKKYSISADDLHDMWMSKYGKDPDTWITQTLTEDLRKWFKEKWVRFGPDGKIRGSCARGSKGEGKPKCLPQKKAQALGKKGRASAARRKRREDPNPNRKGKARNVATKKKSKE